jgi:plastocyanin
MAAFAAPTALAQTNMVSVDIVDDPRPVEKWGYAPASRKVATGTWVTWSNNGYDTHSVTATDESFDSGLLNPSEGFSWYFDQDGTYEYVCTLHTWMTGKVVVGSGVAPEATEEPTAEE